MADPPTDGTKWPGLTSACDDPRREDLTGINPGMCLKFPHASGMTAIDRLDGADRWVCSLNRRSLGSLESLTLTKHNQNQKCISNEVYNPLRQGNLVTLLK